MYVLLARPTRERRDPDAVLPPHRLLVAAASLAACGHGSAVVDGHVLPFTTDDLADHAITVGAAAIVAATRGGADVEDELRDLARKARIPVIPWVPVPDAAARLIAACGAPFLVHGEAALRLPEILRGRDRRGTARPTERGLAIEPAPDVPDLDLEPDPLLAGFDPSPYRFGDAAPPPAVLEASRAISGGRVARHSIPALHRQALAALAEGRARSVVVLAHDPVAEQPALSPLCRMLSQAGADARVLAAADAPF